jgi:hypothetical protein
MKHLFLLSAFGIFISIDQATAQSAVPVNTSANELIIQNNISPNDTASFVWLCNHPEMRSAYGEAQRTAPQASPLLFTNPGFESGDFTDWSGAVGDNDVNSFGPLQNVNPGIYSTTPDALLNNTQARHTIITTAFGNDPVGNFPTIPPGFGNYTARLGGTTPNYQGEYLEQTWIVDPGQPYILISYAVVLQSGGHIPAQCPYFKYEVLDTNNQPVATLYCSLSSPGFIQSTTDTSIHYLPWATDSIALNANIGQTLKLRYTVAGCTQSGHYGYCYVESFYPFATSIAENKASGFSIYPNPANDLVEISMDKVSGSDMIMIRNCLGQPVNAMISATDKGWKIDLSKEASGIYFVEISSGDQRSMQRLIKR